MHVVKTCHLSSSQREATPRILNAWDICVTKKGSFFATAISAVRRTFAKTYSFLKTS